MQKAPSRQRDCSYNNNSNVVNNDIRHFKTIKIMGHACTYVCLRERKSECTSVRFDKNKSNNNMHGFVLDKHSMCVCVCVHFVIVSLHIFCYVRLSLIYLYMHSSRPIISRVEYILLSMCTYANMIDYVYVRNAHTWNRQVVLICSALFIWWRLVSVCIHHRLIRWTCVSWTIERER